jgi:hypothetical protein
MISSGHSHLCLLVLHPLLVSFNPNSEPGAIALSSAKTQFIRDYISAMQLRAKDWTIEKADKLATDELIRAIRYLQEKIEPEPDELQES